MCGGFSAFRAVAEACVIRLVVYVQKTVVAIVFVARGYVDVCSKCSTDANAVWYGNRGM